jgi:sulfonate transport system substrate-binding protein
VIRDGFRLLLVGALLLAGCGGDGGDGGSGDDGGGGSASADAETPPEEPVTIRMGWIPAVSHSEQLSLMSTNPELAPNLGTWYELEFTEFPGTSAIVQGLAAGSLDVGTVGSLTVANGLDQGADLVITGQYIQDREGWGQSIWLVRADSGIDGPDDLAGKTVATNQVGSYVDYVADAYIRDEGGLEANRDYDKVEIPFPQQMDALGSGQTDVGVFVPPFGPTALASGEYEQLFSAIDVQEELIVVLQAFTRGFVEENEAAVQKFVEDFRALSDYMVDPENHETVLESFVETSGQPRETAEAYLLTQDDYYRTPEGAVQPELLQSNWDFFHDQGAFEAELSVEDHVMPELWPSD